MTPMLGAMADQFVHVASSIGHLFPAVWEWSPRHPSAMLMQLFF